MSEKIRILPLLIVVAMLAFSVRVVEVVSGVRDLTGSAVAAGAEQASMPPADELQSGEEKIAMSDTEPEAGEDAEATAEEAPAEENAALGEPPAVDNKWQDATDENYDVSGVKMEMFKDMAARREELDKRERALVTREALLKAAEQEIERKYQEMAALRGEIEGLLEKQSAEEEARIQSLVKIYEGMKPKEAARIFDTLDLDVLSSVMSLMSERRLSPILAAMNPERARTVTIMLAEEKKLPELPDN